MDEFLLANLVDPIDKTPLRLNGDVLHSSSGRAYSIVQGIPVMLVKGIE
jgi:uncharacterized protein YbaR (Trm112 family)